MKKKYALKNYLLFVLALFSINLSAQDVSRVERKANANTQEIQQVKDTISVLSSTVDEQYLEIQRTNDKIEEERGEVDRKIKRINDELGISSSENVDISDVDRFWVIFSAALVFLMQAGFKVLEMGMVRTVHGPGIGIKNLVDFVVTAIIYFLVGFGLMFGFSHSGFVGSDLFMPTAIDLENLFNSGKTDFGLEFFIFQMAFAATAATIVSGAMSERTAFVPYLLIALFVAGFIYPVVGHMVWGNLFLKDNPAWLADLGFIDFAGSTVVHSTGAWVALIGVWIIGPRLGRFKIDGSLNTEKFKPFNLGYSVLGVFILWFGWWGFNGGSNLKLDFNVANIIANTNLAGSFAALVALIHAYAADRDNLIEKVIGGTLTGLVAITASANLVDATGAMAIGLASGLLHNWGWDLMIKFKLDDPVGAIPVHGVGGIWGTIAVAIFGKENKIREYLGLGADDSWVRLDQVMSQFIGMLVVLGFVCLTSFLFFKLIEVTVGLRVDPTSENTGYNLVPERRKK